MTEPRLTNGVLWQFGAPVVAVAFDHDGVGAFACGDGTVRMFADEREPAAHEIHKGATMSLAVHPNGGFLSGGDDGRLVHTVPGGDAKELFAQKGKWIENIAASEATSLIACTMGKDAFVFDGEKRAKFSHATTATGIAFDSKGRRLAVSHYNGVSLWWIKSASQAATVLGWKGSHLGLVWSPDGKFVVSTMQENALHGWRVEDAADMRMSGYPAKIRSFVWEHRGKVLLTSGASRIVGWPFTGRNGPMGKEPLEIGPERDAIVQVVATHPEFDLVAAGTSDGAVWLEWIGESGANFVALDLPKISCLAFSPDGSKLAIGTEEGYAALVDAA
ncbi:MAG: WD40 repeat domain-containing protein [Micropepsaceae bacterium]